MQYVVHAKVETHGEILCQKGVMKHLRSKGRRICARCIGRDSYKGTEKRGLLQSIPFAEDCSPKSHDRIVRQVTSIRFQWRYVSHESIRRKGVHKPAVRCPHSPRQGIQEVRTKSSRLPSTCSAFSSPDNGGDEGQGRFFSKRFEIWWM